MPGISERYFQLQEELKRLAPDRSISVVGVVKHQSIETMKEAIAAGIKVLAHNYAQEGSESMKEIPRGTVQWHFIGHIQSRKVKELPHYDCVQSIDRLEVAQLLSDRIGREAKEDRRMRILIEVNVGGEIQKSGISPNEIPEFVKAVGEMPNLKLEGFMAMAPMLQPVEARRPFFKRMKQLFDSFSAQGLTTLSMGTSEDYAIAVQEGATMIRLGTSLIGARPAKQA